MIVDDEEIRIKGKNVRVNSVRINNKPVIVIGRMIKIACVKDEWYETNHDPLSFIEKLKHGYLKADIFTFIQKPPDLTPQFNYYMEWDNIAAITLKGFEYWWTNQIDSKTRNIVRKAEKSGIIVKVVDFTDEFVRGISEIYNETPIRQGKPFWHYRKDFATLKKIHETFIDRSDFIGAYYKDELVGFIKLVYAGETANTMHIISKVEHRSKSPTNALIAKAVEICCNKQIRYLVYDKFDYGRGGSNSLAEFKSHNGFRKIDLPRYYIPLNISGKIALKLNLHHGLLNILPQQAVAYLLNLRTKWYLKKYGTV